MEREIYICFKNHFFTVQKQKQLKSAKKSTIERKEIPYIGNKCRYWQSAKNSAGASLKTYMNI